MFIVAVFVGIHPHDDAIARFHLLSKAITRLSDRSAEISLVDALDHAAHVVDLPNHRVGVLLYLIGQRFDIPRPAQRIDRAMYTRFVGENLLRA